MWVKICGIADLESAKMVSECAPDAMGLNFYAGSKRCVDVDVAREIVSHLPSSITPVGLFVNHSAEEIRSICDRCGLETIQLHGDETAEFAATLGSYRILKAFRIGSEGPALLGQELQEYQRYGVKLAGCLIDAQVEGTYGGTGHRAPWELLTAWKANWPSLILAGGLKPENVAEAIGTVRPFGVDVASGVELSPGRQNREAVRRFVELARSAGESSVGSFREEIRS